MNLIKLTTLLFIVSLISLPKAASEIPESVVPFDNSPQQREMIKERVIGIELNTNVEFIKPRDQILNSKDTITTYYERGTGFGVYPITINNNQFPLTGWNPLYSGIGARFDIDEAMSVEGVLVAYLLKTFRGTNYDPILAIVYNAQFGLPGGQAITIQDFTIQDIDTSSAEMVFTPIMFDSSAYVSNDFFCVVTTFDGTNEYDATAIYSNSVGDGNEESTIAVLMTDNTGVVSLTLDDLLDQAGVQGPDIDLMMMPIVSTQSSARDYPVTIGNITIIESYPNPADKKFNLKIRMEKPEVPEIFIIDSMGRIVKKHKPEAISAGEHIFDFDISDLPSGNYFYALISGKIKFAGKLLISR